MTGWTCLNCVLNNDYYNEQGAGMTHIIPSKTLLSICCTLKRVLWFLVMAKRTLHRIYVEKKYSGIWSSGALFRYQSNVRWWTPFTRRRLWLSMHACVRCCTDCFWMRSSGCELKCITQMCHNLGRWGPVLKAFVDPQKASEASFDEEMALPFWPECRFFFTFFIFLGKCHYLGPDGSVRFSKSNQDLPIHFVDK